MLMLKHERPLSLSPSPQPEFDNEFTTKDTKDTKGDGFPQVWPTEFGCFWGLRGESPDRTGVMLGSMSPGGCGELELRLGSSWSS